MKRSLKLSLALIGLLNFSIAFSQGDEGNVWDDFGFETSDSINFEEPYPNISIDTSSSNFWQVGMPQKIILDSALSAPNVIITDTIDNYLTNNHSYFDFRIEEEYLWGFGTNLFFGFYHKIDSDTLRDGGYIEVSFDGEQSFVNIIEYPEGLFYEGYPGDDYNELNLYGITDTLFTGEQGFSGTSSDWTLTMFGWHIIPISPPESGTEPGYFDYAKGFLENDVVLRFNFISDSIDNQREGWMIDDIFTFWVDIIGSTSEKESIEFHMFPNPAEEELTILTDKDYRNLQVEISDMTGKEVGTRVYHSGSEIKISDIELNSGFYLISVYGDKQYLGTARLVIRR